MIWQTKIKDSLITFFQRTLWQAKIKKFSIIFFQRMIWQVKIKVSLITSFEIWVKKILFLLKKSLFLSITILSPDFYHLATLSEQNHSFSCKVLTNFINYKICIWCEESIFCRKKWYIKKKKNCVHVKRFTNRWNYLLGFWL